MKNFNCDIIFKQNCPGLGDSLQFSTLPERYAEVGNKFYLHNSNVVNNSEIESLVWLSNPHVEKEKSFEKINCTYHTHMTVDLSTKFKVRNFVEWAEFSHGFEIKNSKPKIYYKPEDISELSEISVLDIGSITCFNRGFYKIESLVNLINKTIDDRKTLLINSKHSFSPILDSFKHLDNIDVQDIYHYSNIIKSCREFYCLYSGGASLASAIREDGAFVFFPDIDIKKEITSGSHLMPNNRYYCKDKTFLNSRADWRF